MTSDNSPGQGNASFASVAAALGFGKLRSRPRRDARIRAAPQRGRNESEAHVGAQRIPNNSLPRTDRHSEVFVSPGPDRHHDQTFDSPASARASSSSKLRQQYQQATLA